MLGPTGRKPTFCQTHASARHRIGQDSAKARLISDAKYLIINHHMTAIGRTGAQAFVIGLEVRKVGAPDVDIELAEQAVTHLDVRQREMRPGDKGIGGQPCIGNREELVEDIEIGDDLFRILQ